MMGRLSQYAAAIKSCMYTSAPHPIESHALAIEVELPHATNGAEVGTCGTDGRRAMIAMTTGKLHNFNHSMII